MVKGARWKCASAAFILCAATAEDCKLVGSVWVGENCARVWQLERCGGGLAWTKTVLPGRPWGWVDEPDDEGLALGVTMLLPPLPDFLRAVGVLGFASFPASHFRWFASFAGSSGWNNLKIMDASWYGPACIIKIVPFRLWRNSDPWCWVASKICEEMVAPIFRTVL